MKTHFLKLVLIILSLSASAMADYAMPPFANALQKDVTHVVDAEVLEITKEGHARLNILHTIKGENPQTLITSTALSCFRSPPGRCGVKSAARYILLLRDSQMFEESTFYEVTKNPEGTLGCQLAPHQKTWLGAPNMWMPLEEMIRLMTPKLK